MVSKAILLIGMSPAIMAALFFMSCVFLGVLVVVFTIDLISMIEKISKAGEND